MSSPTDLSRRTILALAALFSLTPSIKKASAAGTIPRPQGKALVAHFSRSGNTRVLAGRIHRALGTDLFEIAPATPYPEDYEAAVEQARQERDNGDEPPLKSTVPNIGDYETVFLGFPVWGGTAPPVIRSFLSAHDLSGKTLVPFITYGSSGRGNSLSVLADHAPQARLVEGFLMKADQERDALTQVDQWLGDARLTFRER